jgi:hypothetical protein
VDDPARVARLVLTDSGGVQEGTALAERYGR